MKQLATHQAVGGAPIGQSIPNTTALLRVEGGGENTPHLASSLFKKLTL